MRLVCHDAATYSRLAGLATPRARLRRRTHCRALQAGRAAHQSHPRALRRAIRTWRPCANYAPLNNNPGKSRLTTRRSQIADRTLRAATFSGTPCIPPSLNTRHKCRHCTPALYDDHASHPALGLTRMRGAIRARAPSGMELFHHRPTAYPVPLIILLVHIQLFSPKLRPNHHKLGHSRTDTPQ